MKRPTPRLIHLACGWSEGNSMYITKLVEWPVVERVPVSWATWTRVILKRAQNSWEKGNEGLVDDYNMLNCMVGFFSVGNA